MNGNDQELLLSVEDLWVIHVQKADKNDSILKGINFSLNKGEILGLMGRSGCGKTVTAMTIMGLADRSGLRVTSGRILYYGHNSVTGPIDILTAKESELASMRGREIAIISQNPASVLNPVVTVGKQLEHTLAFYNRNNHKSRKAHRSFISNKTEEILSLSGLAYETDILKKYPNQLSTGMCQRVAIGLGICGSPGLLIADEPTASLDPDNKGRIMDILQKLREKLSMSVLLITHDTQGCNYIADRILCISDGRIGEADG